MRRNEIMQRPARSEEPSIRWDKWHVLAGLKAMAVLDLIRTPHSAEARPARSEELATGGWAADDRYFKAASKPVLGGDYVNWGSDKNTMNEWITADALTVLHAAGRC